MRGIEWREWREGWRGGERLISKKESKENFERQGNEIQTPKGWKKKGATLFSLSPSHTHTLQRQTQPTHCTVVRIKYCVPLSHRLLPYSRLSPHLPLPTPSLPIAVNAITTSVKCASPLPHLSVCVPVASTPAAQPSLLLCLKDISPQPGDLCLLPRTSRDILFLDPSFSRSESSAFFHFFIRRGFASSQSVGPFVRRV